MSRDLTPRGLAVRTEDGTVWPICLTVAEYQKLTGDRRTGRAVRADLSHGVVPSLTRAARGRWRIPTVEVLRRLGVEYTVTTA